MQGIGGSATRRLVIINGQTFQKGDSSNVKAGNKRVEIRCLEVRESLVFVSIDGIEGLHELELTKN